MFDIVTIPPPSPCGRFYRAWWKILQHKSTQTLLQPPYLVLPPTGADQLAGPRTKKSRDLGLEHREGRRKKEALPVVHQSSESIGWSNSPTPYTVVGYSIHWELLGCIRAVGKNQITLVKALVKGRVLKLWLKKSLGTEILNREEHRSCPSE